MTIRLLYVNDKKEFRMVQICSLTLSGVYTFLNLMVY